MKLGFQVIKFDEFLKEQGIYEETKVRAVYQALVELVQEFYAI